jgi:putative transposase
VSGPARREIVAAIDEAIANGARQFKACEAIGLCSRRLRRWRLHSEDGRNGGYRATGQKLVEEEKTAIVAAATSPEMADLPIRVVHTRLLDQGIYIGSYSAFVRVLNACAVTNRKLDAVRQARKKPELVATGPNQVWCWDITWLPSTVDGKYFYLYMIIDMYSRKIVGWSVFAKEDGEFARMLFAETFTAEGVGSHQIIIHSDNGKPMRSCTLEKLFDLLHVIASHSRPHTSNDNAYSESLFATMKGRVLYPEFFTSIDHARNYCAAFVRWYNEEHLHGGLDYVTPSVAHAGLHADIYAKRNALLEKDRLAHPVRHGGRRKVFGMESVVRLKHRVRFSEKSRDEKRREALEAKRGNATLTASDKAEAGSAGEQPARNTLTDRDDREVGL